MDLSQRIKLMDDVRALNEESKLPETEIAGFVAFLAESPQELREAVLNYVVEADRFVRLEYWVKLANKPEAERAQVLKAFGIEQADDDPLTAAGRALGLELMQEKAGQFFGDLASAAGEGLMARIKKGAENLFGPKTKNG